jgi:hypothetical protein
MDATFQTALVEAQSLPHRDLSVTESQITCIAYVPELRDFFRCCWRAESVPPWQLSCEPLPPSERFAEELIQDSHIVAAAREGDRILALRLYRLKYSADLATAVRGLEWLLNID